MPRTAKSTIVGNGTTAQVEADLKVIIAATKRIARLVTAGTTKPFRHSAPLRDQLARIYEAAIKANTINHRTRF